MRSRQTLMMTWHGQKWGTAHREQCAREVRTGPLGQRPEQHSSPLFFGIQPLSLHPWVLPLHPGHTVSWGGTARGRTWVHTGQKVDGGHTRRLNAFIGHNEIESDVHLFQLSSTSLLCQKISTSKCNGAICVELLHYQLWHFNAVNLTDICLNLTNVT